MQCQKNLKTKMKILKILFISFVILILVLVLVVIIFVKTFDVNRFKPQIKSLASKALNRQVDFDRINPNISLRQGISLKIHNLVIADDPVFGRGEFVAIKDISLAVDVLGYIFQRKVNVANVLINSARVRLIRQKDGTLNVQSLTKFPDLRERSHESMPAAAPLAIPAFLISSLKGSNSSVEFIDQSFQPPLRLEISDLDFSMNKISLNEPFVFVIEAAVLSAKKNIKIAGKAQLNLKTKEVRICELRLKTELSCILLERIPVVFPMTKGALLPVNLKGKVQVVVNEMTVGAKGVLPLMADGLLTHGELQFKEIVSPIKDIEMNIKIRENKILLEEISAAIGEGRINGSGLIEDYLARQDFSVSADIENIKIEEFIAHDKSVVKAEGVVSGKMRFKGQGFSLQSLRSTLSGGADIVVKKAKLENINVLRRVLDKISVIPGLAQKIEANLSERFKQKLTQKDTLLSDIKLPITVEDGRLVAKDALLGADEFLFKGQGQVGFDGIYGLEGSFLIPPELSASIVSAVPELQYLLNDENQIYIPLKISGRVAEQLKFNVDAEYIAQRLLLNQAKQQIFKALDKALGTKEAETTEQNAPQEGSKNKSATQEAIGSILSDIFR
jgi:uncharacterized protein involved in outer membrane biogenesis